MKTIAYYTQSEAASLLGVSHQRVAAMLRDGLLPPTLTAGGTTRLIAASDLRRLIAERAFRNSEKFHHKP